MSNLRTLPLLPLCIPDTLPVEVLTLKAVIPRVLVGSLTSTVSFCARDESDKVTDWKSNVVDGVMAELAVAN